MRNLTDQSCMMVALITVLVGASIFGYSGHNNAEAAQAASPPRIERLFEKTKTICIGRFLIDIPVDSQAVYGPAEVPLPLEVYKGKGPAMEDIIRDRLFEIDEERRYAEGRLLDKDAIIGAVMAGGMPRQKIVFGVSQSSGVFYRLQSFLRRGDDLFVQETEASGSKEKYEEDIRKLNVMARLLGPREEMEIPKKSGVCIENGFVAEPPKGIREYVTLGVRLSQFPDVHFSMSTTTKKRRYASDALEPRLKEAEANARVLDPGDWYSRIKTLRRGKREIGSWKGFEVLVRLPPQKTEGQSHEFRYLSQGEPKNALLPLLDFELRTGVRGDDVGGAEPSLRDEEAISLWDKLTGSIRLRAVTEQ